MTSDISQRGARLMVTAIDIGTTFSGYAFSLRSDFEANPLSVYTNDWSSDGSTTSGIKAPSVLLLKEDKSFDSFGFAAQSKFIDLLEDLEDAANYYYIQDFKMQLHNRDISLDMFIKDVGGKEILALTVFSEVIRYIKNHCLDMFKDRKLPFSIDDIFFVITVPAIWTDGAKQFMREASQMAGIGESQMTLVYEPEAAALHCSVLPADYGIAKYFEVGRKIIIVDLGGGTADMTVVKIVKKENNLSFLEHVFKVSGGAWGGNQVNKNFESFLESIFGQDVLNQLKRHHLAEYMEMMKDFETKKKGKELSEQILGSKKKFVIKIGGEIKTLFKEMKGKDIEKVLKESSNGQVEITRDKLKLDISIFQNFYSECVQKIISHVNETFMNPDCAFPSAMLLVGGFSDSPFVRKAVVDAFPAIKDIVTPLGSSMSILKGAVIFGHAPTVITGRICRETLGVALHRPYVPNVHPQEKTFRLAGKLRVDDCFERMFKVNEVIQLYDKRIKEVHDLHTDSNLTERRKLPKTVEIYSSHSEDPKYVTDDGCKLKGRITVFPPNGEWPEIVEGFIELEAGGTEITVRYRDRHSGKTTEGKIDFM